MLHKANATYLTVVLITSAVMRMGFLLWSWSDSQLFTPQSVLSRNYFKEGYAIAAGYGYVLGTSPKGLATLEELYHRVTVADFRARPNTVPALARDDVQAQVVHPPGMSLLIAAVHRTFGIRADVPVQLVAVALDTAAAGIFWWIVTTFFNSRAGLMAGLLYALFPPFAAYAVAKETDGMLGFFVVAFLASTLKATTQEGWHRQMWNMLAGACIGVGSYVRPDYLLVPVVIFFGLWAYTRQFQRSLVAAGVIQIVAFLLLLPWAYRNYGVCGRWIFTSTSVGGTLVASLGEFHNPWGLRVLDEDRATEAAAQSISNPWGCEGDLYFREIFFKSIQQHPGAYIMAIVKRVPFVLATPYDFGFKNPWKTSTFSEARRRGEDQYQVLMRRPWYVLAAYWDHLTMAVFTLVCLLLTIVMAQKERSRWGLILLMLSPHLYSIGAHLFTHLEPRYLLPSMFCWLIGPAYVISHIRPLQRAANCVKSRKATDGFAI